MNKATITNCQECGHCAKDLDRDVDSFEFGTSYILYCGKADGKKIGYADWRQRQTNVPDWCPLKVNV